jgi:hypothetical protein
MQVKWFNCIAAQTFKMLVRLLELLVKGTGDNMPHKQAKTATNKLKAHQNDANASFAHRTGDPERFECAPHQSASEERYKRNNVKAKKEVT